MRKLLLVLALLLAPSTAWAQCTGTFPNNTICGNTTGVTNTPRPTAAGSFVLGLAVGTTPITGGTNQYLLFNNNGVLGNESIAALLAAPTAAIGLSTINGTALTAMRSDAAPALSSAVQTALTQTNNQVLIGTGAFGFSSLAPVNNAVLQTNGSGVPSWVAGLPSGALANPNCTVGLSAVNGVATTAERTDSSCALSQAISPTWTGNHTFNPASGTAITVNTVAGTGLGFNITNAGSSATLGADFLYNSVLVSNDAAVGSAGKSTFGFQSSLQVLTNTAKGTKYGGRGIVNQSASGMATGGDAIGWGNWCITNQSNGGTNTGAGAAGTCFGSEHIAHLFSGATNYLVVGGAEFDSLIDSGATAANRWGINISGNGAVRGAVTDAAIQIGAPTSTGSFTTTILWSNINGFAPIPTGGTMLGSDGSSVTTTNFASLSTYTFTGSIFDFGTPFKVTGAGAGTLAVSLTNPLDIGGSGTTGTQKTFQTTTGVGTTDSFVWKRGNNGATLAMTLNNTGLGVGSVGVPDALLTVNGNTAATVAPPITTSIHGVATDAQFGGALFDSFGTGTGNFFSGRISAGTLASKSATVSGEEMLSFRGYPWDGSSYNLTVDLRLRTAENQDGTHHGSFIQFRTTPTASTTIAEAMRVQPSGGLSIGTTTDPGIGSLQLNAQIFMPNITTSSAAQNGTVCWTTGTGKFTVDTTVGCLTSLAKAKNIDADLSPRYALNIVERLQPISFHYRKGWGDSGHYEQFGFIADQAATIDERLVGRDPNGELQGFRYQEYGAVLTAAMKALKADNDNIESRLEKLERRVAR